MERPGNRCPSSVLMSRLPRQREAFAEQVLKLLHRLRPDLNAILSGPAELVVEGRRLDLENLMRLVRTDEGRGVEIVEQYLEQLFDDSTIAISAMPWEVARDRIMPRIQPVTIFEHLSREQVAHVPYVNETVIVFVIDMPNMTVSVTTEQMIRWGADTDILDELARRNLRACTTDLEFRTLESEDGGKAVLLTIQDGYDASRLLLEDLHIALAPHLGGDFLVATPSRDMLLAVTRSPEPFISRVREKVLADFTRLPYPITSRLFYVCRDGVAGSDAANLAA